LGGFGDWKGFVFVAICAHISPMKWGGLLENFRFPSRRESPVDRLIVKEVFSFLPFFFQPSTSFIRNADN
jgi:hypothetical protein